jgi:hypothetical protein
MKKMLIGTMAGLLVASVAFLSTDAKADSDDDDLKPGGKGAVTGYDDAGKVVKVEQCIKGRCYKGICSYNCTTATKKLDKSMRNDWCVENKTKNLWWWQVANRPKAKMTCANRGKAK